MRAIIHFPCSRAVPLFAFLAMFAVMAVLPAQPAGAGPHLVFDYNSGRVYSRHMAFDRWHPASLTKMMTAYTVFRQIRTGTISQLSPVRISTTALREPPSKMGFPVGTILNIDAALKIILVKSANDVSTALAESVAGSAPKFVALMNRYAREIGMTDSNFVNAHGLHHPNQYTTARDLAILARQIYREFPKKSAYFSIPAIKLGGRHLRNHNPLLQRLPGTFGMKTGYVCEAGLNIVAAAKLRGKTLIAVVLGGKSGRARNVEAAKLLKMAARPRFAFSLPKLDKLDRPPSALRRPVNMRSYVCGGKAPPPELLRPNLRKASLLAKPEDLTLEEMEKKYLLEKGRDTRVVPIVFGNAVGPDPYGLLGPASEDPARLAEASSDSLAAASAFVAVEDLARDVAEGRSRLYLTPEGERVPIPTPRPGF